jgi:hypothetical protein
MPRVPRDDRMHTMTWDEVVTIASALPEVVVSTSYGTPALKVRGKLLTRLRPEDDSLVLLGVPPDERDMLIEADPGTYHTTPHYDGYDIVLARLASLTPQAARSFLERRWRDVVPKRMVAAWEAQRSAPPPR